jgi:putative ABC transport system permease protein
MAVCVIGANIHSRFFSRTNPIGKQIKFGNIWLKIIGVLDRNVVNVTGQKNAGVNVTNDNIYVPVKTMLLRFNNRSLLFSGKAQAAGISVSGGAIVFTTSSRPRPTAPRTIISWIRLWYRSMRLRSSPTQWMLSAVCCIAGMQK